MFAHCDVDRFRARTFWCACACACLGLLVTASLLRPETRGLGTHLQLGLPRCAFLLWTGLPCPGCGLTTAFAYMIRFDVSNAVRSNAVGVPLFLCALAGAPSCMLAAARGLCVERTLKRLRLARVAAIIGLTALLSWLARIAAIT